jgi:hypothetical protein
MRHHQGNLHGKNKIEYKDINSKMWKDAMYNMQVNSKEELQKINTEFKKEKENDTKKKLQAKWRRSNEMRKKRKQGEEIKEKEKPSIKKIKKSIELIPLNQ